MDLYPHRHQPEPSRELFARPAAAYRAAPFWSWNGLLQEQRLLAQIDQLADMGLGGVHPHSRTGLATPYLGPEFMRLIRSSVEHCKHRGMLTWLYDEDRWPSGFAGGLATADPDHRLRYLLFTPRTYAQDPGRLPGPSSRAERGRTGQGTLLASYALSFADGQLRQARRITDQSPCQTHETAYHAYLEICPPTSWYGDRGPLDVLNPQAVANFIRITHEAYRAAVGDHFGTTIPAIFTDEPLFTGKTRPAAWDDRADQWLPWTDNLAHTLLAAHGIDILPLLPALFFDGLPDTDHIRWCWHDHLAERFRAAFAEPIARWCHEHGILMTGHLESEERLDSQIARNGECMRFYQPMHLPGIDLLCDNLELSTALQARSVARQQGRPGVMSELYGVTNWDFDFTGHKRQGDWQAALGITVRVPHLAWYTMAGEAKRDYPAGIDAHSPWYRQYPLVEDHFARLNTCLTRGQPVTRVGLIHPVESAWIAWGQRDTRQQALDGLEEQFQYLIRCLLHGLIDADLIAESLLYRQPPPPDAPADGRLHVGKAAYDAVLLPALHTIRSTTLAALEAHLNAGGTVLLLGPPPPLLDARPSDRPGRVLQRARSLPAQRCALLDALEPLREIDVRTEHGARPEALLHQIRQDGSARWIFLCNTDRSTRGSMLQLRLRGNWSLQRWDTLSATVHTHVSTCQSGWTHTQWLAHPAGHLLLHATPAEPAQPVSILPAAAQPALREVGRLDPPHRIELDEPNVLLLDRAEGRLNDHPWTAPTETLRLDNLFRSQIGLGPITSRIVQPWLEPNRRADHTAALRYSLQLEADLPASSLALERAAEATIRLNDQPVPANINGWWVDPDIQTVPLPPLPAGNHTLCIQWPYGAWHPLEWVYLLGPFAVRVCGRSARIAPGQPRPGWGPLDQLGLPFYGANLHYHCRWVHAGGPAALRFHRFRAPLLRVALNGADVGPVAFPPYELHLGHVGPGEHQLTITCFGNRYPSFGQLHHAQPERHRWWGPDSWRTTGDDWSEEYVLKPQGILSAPIVLG